MVSVKNAYSHWQKYRKEFPEYNNSLEYVKAVHDFISNPPYGYAFDNPIRFIDSDGLIPIEGGDPPYTIKQVIEFGQKSTYFASLLTKTGITIDNFSEYISFSDSDDKNKTYTDPLTKKIKIDSDATIEENVLGLAHELTNLTLANDYNSLLLDVTFDSQASHIAANRVDSISYCNPQLKY